MTSAGLAQLEWSATYRPFGEAHAITGTESLALRFPGQLFDPETGFHQNWHRDYDPRLGRYLQSDPIGLAGGLNTYAYTFGDPVNLIDPSGSLVPLLIPALLACAADPLCAVPLLGAAYYAQQALGQRCPLPDRSFSKSSSEQSDRPPFRGEPGSKVRTLHPDGTPKQERHYGDDGFPEKDIDFDHDHGQGKPHVHDWDRPPGGSTPTHKNRRPGRSPKPGELTD